MWELLSVFLAGVFIGFVAGAVPFGILLLRSAENTEEALRILRSKSRRGGIERGRREEYWS